ncbi:MAG TPA: hypothetical protein VGM84_11945 [Steroidobacteraceae bacterium]|jgi:hypothetical protein
MRVLLMSLMLLVAAVVHAQEGFPLDGTWRGQRQDGTGTPVTIVMVLSWDGKNISGIIDPGPDSIQIAKAELVPDGWRVKIEAHTKTGEAISFTGAIDKLGAYDRTITGTWTEGARSYSVRMTRE